MIIFANNPSPKFNFTGSCEYSPAAILITIYPKGVMVKLNSGDKGIVTNTNIGYIGRPVIRICYDRNGNTVTQPYDVNLTSPDNQNNMIVEVLYN